MFLNKQRFFQQHFFIYLLVVCCLIALCPGSTYAAPCTKGYSVILTGVGSSKMQTIKALRALTGLGLRDAKDLVEAIPAVVGRSLVKEEAIRLQMGLEEAGARVRIECTTKRPVHPLPPPPPPDMKPPKVSIETDTILVKTVGDRLRVRGRAEDNDKVASITIYAQGRSVKTCAAWECWYGEEVSQPGPRRYYAVALDRAGNRATSSPLEFMVHASTKPGPSLNLRTDPFHPTTNDRVRFIARAAHSRGVRDITFYIAGRPVHTCRANSCEYKGGPYPAGNLIWRVSARSRDGGETYGSDNMLTVKAAPTAGRCTIAGKAYGSGAAAAPAFFVNLYGPNVMNKYRQTKSFASDGRYQFDNLPEGRYRLRVDTRGDLPIGVFPSVRTLECRGSGPRNVNFDFR